MNNVQDNITNLGEINPRAPRHYDVLWEDVIICTEDFCTKLDVLLGTANMAAYNRKILYQTGSNSLLIGRKLDSTVHEKVSLLMLIY